MTSNVGGPVTPHVPDSTKIVCPRCNGTAFQISSTLDDPNDITRDLIFAALDITFADGVSCQGLVALCHCGNEFVPWWMIFDVGTTAAATFITTMTNLDAGTADLLAGCYGLCLVGTSIEKYYIIATHTAAAPTAITWTAPKPADDADGYWVITNILPVGFTLGA